MINKIKHKVGMLVLYDIVVIVISYFLSFAIEVGFNRLLMNQYMPKLLQFFPIFMMVHGIFYIVFKIHRCLWKFTGIDEVFRISNFLLLSSLVVLAIRFLILSDAFPGNILIISLFLSVLSMLGARVIYRYLRKMKNLSLRHENAIIIGAGEAGSLLCREIISNDQYKVKIVGFLDDSKQKQRKILNGYKVLGTINNLAEIKEKYQIHQVYIAIPSASKQEIKNILNICQNCSIAAKIMTIKIAEQVEEIHLRDISIEDLLGRGEIKLDVDDISSYICNRSIMVTGAGGSIGSELCRQIVGFYPKQLIMIDMYENNLYDLQMEMDILKRQGILSDKIKLVYVVASVRDRKAIGKLMQQYLPDTLYHAAAYKHVPLMEDAPHEAIKNNILGTRNVLLECIYHKVKRFVLVSTDKAVNPTNVMGATKRMSELLIQAYKNNGITTIAAVRFGNVLGSNGSVVPVFKKQIVKGGPITVTHPDIVRYFMTISESVQLVLQAGSYASNGEIFVLDMGEPVKILDFAKNMILLSGLKPDEDISIEFTGLRAGEKMFEELMFDNNQFTKTNNELIFIAHPENINIDNFEMMIQHLELLLNKPSEEIKTQLLRWICLDYELENEVFIKQLAQVDDNESLPRC